MPILESSFLCFLAMHLKFSSFFLALITGLSKDCRFSNNFLAQIRCLYFSSITPTVSKSLMKEVKFYKQFLKYVISYFKEQIYENIIELLYF